MAQIPADTNSASKPRPVRRITFYVVVGLTLAAMAAYPPLLIIPVAAWLDESVIDSLFNEDGLGFHRAHLVGASLLFWLTIVAMISQFRGPETKPAPVWAAAVAWVVFVPMELTHLVDPFSIILILLLVSVLALHPRRWPEDPLEWRTGVRMVALIGAAGAVVYGFQQALLQIGGTPQDPHVSSSHYALMAAIAVGLAASTLLGATNFPGGRVSAWSSGIMAMILGIFFIGHPDQASSLGGAGILIIGWAVIYLWATTHSPRSPRAAGKRGVPATPATPERTAP